MDPGTGNSGYSGNESRPNGQYNGRDGVRLELPARQTFLESVLANTSDAVLVTEGAPLDEPGPKVVYVNRAFTAMTGYSEDEVLGGTPRMLQGPGTDRAELGRIRASLERGERVRGELLNYRKDGSSFWVEMDVVPVPGDGDGPDSWVSVQRETTGRREAEEHLRRTEKTLRTLLAQHETEMITVLDPDGTPRYESSAIERALGYRHAEQADGEFFRHVHPDDRARLESAVTAAFGKPGQSAPVEYRIRRADGEWLWFESAANNLVEHPEVRGIVVNTRDVTGRREAEEALRESEERFRSLVQNSSEVVKICDPDGTLRYASPAFEKMFGYTPEEATGMNVLDKVHPEDLPRVIEQTRESLRGTDGASTNVSEYRFLHADGSWRNVESVGTYLLDDPAVRGILVNTRDVTRRKEAEKKLKDAEARYRSLVERIPAATYIDVLDDSRPSGYVSSYVSPQIEGMLGYPPESFVEDPDLWPGLLHPDDREGTLAADARHYRTGEAYLREYRMVRRDGEVIWVRDEAVALLSEADGTRFAHGMIFDITDRKEAEQRLEEAEVRYRSLVETVPAITYTEDFATRATLYDSPQIEAMLGYPRDIYLEDPDYWTGIIHPDDVERVSAEEERSAETGDFELEYRVFAADGRTVWVREQASVVRDAEGRPKAWQGLIFDVTGRRETEERLRSAELRYRTMIEEVPAITYVHSQEPGDESQTTYISPQIRTILGYRPEEYTADPEFWKTLLHPDDLERVIAEDLRTGKTGEPFRIDFRMIAKDGRTVWLREDGRLIESERGHQTWHGVMFDITGIKEAEARVREAEIRFRTLVEQVPAVTYVEGAGSPAPTSYVSPQVEAMLGYSPDEWTSDPGLWVRTLHPEDRERVLAEDRRAEDTGGRFLQEFRHVARDGRVVWVRDEAEPVRDEDGNVLFWQGVLLDITDRKEAERRLEEAEARHRSLVEHIPAFTYTQEAVGPGGEVGRITYASPQVKAMFGYTPEEWTSDPRLWLTLVHPDDKQRVVDEEFRTEETGEPFAVEYRSFTRDGGVIWVHEESVLVRGDAGEPLYWQGIQLDITSRKEAEERLSEAENRYRSLVEHVPGITYIEDAENGATLYDSPQIEAMLGYPRDTCEKDPDYWWKIVHPDDLERVRREEVRSEETGEFRLEYRVFTADGGTVWLLDEAAIVRGTAGERDIWQGFLFDITDRKHAEEKLRETEERHRTLIEQIPAVTYIQEIDHSYTATYISPQMEELLGYRPEEFYEDESLWYGTLHPDDRDWVAEEDDLTDRTGEPFLQEYRMVRRDGGVVWVHDEARLLRNADGSHRFWHGVIYDITERKTAEETLRRSEERFRSLVQNASDLIVILGRDLRTLYLSPSFEKVQGYAPERNVGRDAMENIHPEDREAVAAGLAQLLTVPSSVPTLDFRLRHRDGSWLHLEAIGRNLLSDPAVGGIVINARDITERKLAEQALRESEQRLKSVTSGAPIILFAIDREGKVILSEGKGLSTLNLNSGYGVGDSVFEAYQRFPIVLESVGRALEGEEVAATIQIGEFTFDARYSPILDENGEVSGAIGVATDITERQKLERELEHRALHDSLTGLANRALCMDRLSHALERGDRRASPVSLLFMDLDDFKLVNDSLGHSVGDALLIEVARRLGRCVRPGDTLARLGGDEFVVLLEDTGLEGALRVVERVEAALEPPVLLGDGHERYVTASIGVTVSELYGKTAEDLLREADLAMYQAKDQDKAHHEVFDADMSARVLERTRLESSVRRALEGDQFEVHYQPIVQLRDGRVSGFEALIRWRHPEKGLIYPDDFIPLMEETGLIIPLGRLVFERACRNLSGWQAMRPDEPLDMTVNLSPRQFKAPDLVGDIERALAGSGVSPESFYLEITESVVMGDSLEMETMEHLKTLGLGLMVDDFGTGHSSLSYLKKLPVDFLKVDRSFIVGLGEDDPMDREIVSAIVRLGHAVGLKVVAEGVENAEQISRLGELGCDYAQGYFFSRPVPAEEVPDLIRATSLR